VKATDGLHTLGCIGVAALKFCFKTCVAMKFVDNDDDDDDITARLDWVGLGLCIELSFEYQQLLRLPYIQCVINQSINIRLMRGMSKRRPTHV